MRLLSVQDARARMLTGAERLSAERVALDDLPGRVLAEPVIARRDQPPFDASAMDGWAVRTADLVPSGATLAVAGESAAGRGFDGPMAAGEAVRIFTGARLPEGADRVVMQEDAERQGGRVRVGPASGQTWVRPRAGDFAAGATLLPAGSRLDAWSLALVAASGAADAVVARRPRVAILSTGEELAAPGVEPGLYVIFDSAGPALAARAHDFGAIVSRPPPAGDDEAAIMAAVEALDVDLLVTVGGASVGDHDLVRPALARLGLELAVESVAVRPGKPTWFGRLPDGRRLLGLPGNPASALVCAELFLRPLLLALQGADPTVPMRRARLSGPVAATGPREHWMRAATSEGGGTVRPFRDQDSSLVTVFASADALVRLPAGTPALERDDMVDILPLGR